MNELSKLDFKIKKVEVRAKSRKLDYEWSVIPAEKTIYVTYPITIWEHIYSFVKFDLLRNKSTIDMKNCNISSYYKEPDWFTKIVYYFYDKIHDFIRFKILKRKLDEINL